MRIVTKTNLALGGVVALSALLNFTVLEWTIMPSFLDLERESAARNQSRAIEAIQVQTDQVAASSRDYAFWDDSYAFMQGKAPGYEDVNVSEESLKALNVNYFLAVDGEGHVTLDKGFDYSGDEPMPVRLLDVEDVSQEHPFRRLDPKPESDQGLMRTEGGIVAVGYSPVLTTERGGPAMGSLVFGKVLDLDALRKATRVDFDLIPVGGGDTPSSQTIETGDSIESRTVLNGIDGKPLVVLASKIDRQISSAGKQAVWIAMILLAAGGALLIVTLAMLLRRIVLARVEAMRSHLMTVASTGSLKPIPADDHGDELSDTVASFNQMTAQLAELREELRRRDYHQGAADQAAGILHNVRNAVNPIGTIAWELLREEDAPWKQNLAKAVAQLSSENLATERAEKLNKFIVLSAAQVIEEGPKRRANLEALGAMVRHVDRILKDEDAVSQSPRAIETINLAACTKAAAAIVQGKAGVDYVSEVAPDLHVAGHQIALEQVLANLLVNASEAIAAANVFGTISVTVEEVMQNGSPALDIRIADNGDGIPADRLEAIFEKGYSTRRERSSGLGLHWCANAVNAMKGQLYAESPGAGQGATLHVVLPKAGGELRKAA